MLVYIDLRSNRTTFEDFAQNGRQLFCLPGLCEYALSSSADWGYVSHPQ